jgi:hypothetical protein
MIKFFRHFRQQLLSNGKTEKYFKYAFGEIILVVIGILIALAINNWNSNRLLRNSAYENMRALYKNIEDDINQLQNSKSFMDSVTIYSNKLNMTFQERSKVNEKTIYYLLELLLERNITINSNTFETLNRNGEFIALDKTLQNQIVAYYSSIERVIEREHISNGFIQRNYEPYLLRTYNYVIMNKANPWESVQDYLENDPRDSSMISDSVFLEDNYLEALVFARYYQIKSQKESYEKALDVGNKLLGELQGEIGKFSND